jgi:hypothetical protein
MQVEDPLYDVILLCSAGTAAGSEEEFGGGKLEAVRDAPDTLFNPILVMRANTTSPKNK